MGFWAVDVCTRGPPVPSAEMASGKEPEEPAEQRGNPRGERRDRGPVGSSPGETHLGGRGAASEASELWESGGGKS